MLAIPGSLMEIIRNIYFTMKTYSLYYSVSESSYSLFDEYDETNLQLLPSDAERIWSITTKSFEIACLKEHEFLGWEPYKPLIIDEEDLFKLLPEDKYDIDNFQLLQNLGYPIVEAVLFQLFEWIQDMNWPVAQEIAPFLALGGDSIIPHVKKILKSDDGIWKYWTLNFVMDEVPISVLKNIKKELEYLIENKTDKDIREEVDILAKKLLKKINQGEALKSHVTD